MFPLLILLVLCSFSSTLAAAPASTVGGGRLECESHSAG
jgi:hypothetical protein